MIKLFVASALAVSAAVSVAGESPAPAYLPGVWSIGETKNCASGPAWAFLADGYYAEVTLPDKGPLAMGLWKDEASALAYTHSHMPFPDMLKVNTMSRMTIDQRTPDMLVMKNARGMKRVFHRCPAGSLKAPAAQAAH